MDFFDEYVKKYDFTDADISYKYYHTLRVVNFCELIAKGLQLNDRDIEIAKLCGLYHDIGRFEQDKRYNSFVDNIIYDHGNVGKEIFENIIAHKLSISDEEKEIISKSILYHNKYSVGECTEREKMFCDITRDADKIDILNVFANKIKLLNKSSEDISLVCHNDFMNNKSILKDTIQTKNDELLLTLAYIFDINFDVSIDIIRKEKYYEKIEKILDNNKFDVYFEKIKTMIKEK